MISPSGGLFEDRRNELETSILRAQECLRVEFQHEPDDSRHESRPASGFWCGELEADSTVESDYIIFLSYVDRERYTNKIRKLAKNIVKHQLDDGSWNIYFGGPGEISATVKAYLALRLAGYDANEPFMSAAREASLRLGGAEKVNSFTKFYLALLGQVEWEEVPAIPPEVMLLPKFSPINIYEISYWSRAILVPLSILYSTRAAQQPKEGLLIEDLFHDRSAFRRNFGTNQDVARVDAGIVAGLESVVAEQKSDGTAPNDRSKTVGPPTNGNGNSLPTNGNGNRALAESNGTAFFSWENFFLGCDRLIKLVEKTPFKPLRKLALKKARDWMVDRFEDSDGLGAIFPGIVNSVMALLSLGYSQDDPHIIEAMEQLERLEIDDGDIARLQPCLSPIWDTAKAVNAMHESGVAADDEVLLAAGRWLVSKEVRRPGDWKIRVPHVEVGGWPFQFRNEFYPDVDDTAAVVMALGRMDSSRVEGIEASIMRGIQWVTDMQCSGGGWAAFDVDVEREFLTKVPYADHNAMLDPPCADITGRCLEMYGRFPELLKRPEIREVVRRGIDYMKRVQENDGSWYGRWGVNYIYGTWQAIKGLVAVGENPRSNYIQRAVEFLRSRQNADGGWGESCSSYDENCPVGLRGRGESTASQTAWALMGLIAAGDADCKAAERGITYLLDNQGEDGNWEEDEWTGTGFPCVFYLKYHMYRLYFPLWALGMYRNSKSGISKLGARRHEQLEEVLESSGRNAPRRGLRALFGN